MLTAATGVLRCAVVLGSAVMLAAAVVLRCAITLAAAVVRLLRSVSVIARESAPLGLLHCLTLTRIIRAGCGRRTNVVALIAWPVGVCLAAAIVCG